MAEECNDECNDLKYCARGESVHILEKLHWCVMEMSFLVDAP